MGPRTTPAAIAYVALAAVLLSSCGPGPEADEPGAGGGTSGGASGDSGDSDVPGSRGSGAAASADDVVIGSGTTGEPIVAGPESEEGCDSGIWRDGVQVCDDDTTSTCRATWEQADECFLQSDCGEPACKVLPPPGHGGGGVPDCMCSCSEPQSQ